MRCTRAVHQIHLYIDHQLTMRQIRVLEAHISSCPACHAELILMEAASHGLDALKAVPEPTNMHEQIMQKVAFSAARKKALLSEKQSSGFKLFRPSFSEMLAAVLLATMATLLKLLQQPRLIPTTSASDPFSLFYMFAVNRLTSIDPNALNLIFWIVGTLLGVLITLMVAGNELRTQWFKAIRTRLPVHQE